MPSSAAGSSGHVIPRLAAVGGETELEIVFADGELAVRRADKRARPRAARGRRAGQPAVSAGERGIDRLLAVMRRLRDPERGCPWDIEQTFATIAPYTIEEAYEVADAIEREDWADLPGELGDLLLQVVYYTQMGAEQGRFDFDAVAHGIADKMIERHPHVFGAEEVAGSAALKTIWEERKAAERARQGWPTPACWPTCRWASRR